MTGKTDPRSLDFIIAKVSCAGLGPDMWGMGRGKEHTVARG